MNDLFSHFNAFISYTKAWPSDGDDIRTSDRPAKVVVTADPPPPDPPTDLNKPPGNIL